MPASKHRSSAAQAGAAESAAALIVAKIQALGDWRGALLPDPARLFNSSLEGGAALKALVRAAVELINNARATASRSD